MLLWGSSRSSSLPFPPSLYWQVFSSACSPWKLTMWWEVPFDLSVDGVEGHPSVSAFFSRSGHHLRAWLGLSQAFESLVAPSCTQEKPKSGLGVLGLWKQGNRTQFLLPDAMESATGNSDTTVWAALKKRGQDNCHIGSGIWFLPCFFREVISPAIESQWDSQQQRLMLPKKLLSGPFYGSSGVCLMMKNG